MRLLAIGLLSGALLTSGCTRQEVNEYSVFEYRSSDDTCDVALKTSGNLLPWVGEGVVLGVYVLGVAGYAAIVAAAAQASR